MFHVYHYVPNHYISYFAQIKPQLIAIFFTHTFSKEILMIYFIHIAYLIAQLCIYFWRIASLQPIFTCSKIADVSSHIKYDEFLSVFFSELINSILMFYPEFSKKTPTQPSDQPD